MPTLNTLIPIIFIATTLASLYTYYSTRILGDFIRILVRKNAKDEESSLSVSDFSLGNKMKDTILEFSLSKTNTLRRFVAQTEIDGKKKYYLVPETSENALKRFDAKGLKFITVIICIAIMAVFSLVVSLFVPYMNAILDDYAGNPSETENTTKCKTDKAEEDTEEKDNEDNTDGTKYESRYETAE